MNDIRCHTAGPRGLLLSVVFVASSVCSIAPAAGDAVQSTPAGAGATPGDQSVALPPDARPLSTVEIREVFADVRDDAEVRDSAGTRAVNYWYADGRFVNQWFNSGRSGKVTGRWRADNNQRCVLIQSGLPDRVGVETCAPVYQRGSTYLSINPDGSIHGVHTLSPIRAP